MANRPVFIPILNGQLLVAPVGVEFTWAAGLAISQKQKNIRSLHAAAVKQCGLNRLLEISSKSESCLGVELSAFNLQWRSPAGIVASVESHFQASKVFAGGGPFVDLLAMSSREAKRDPRLRGSGALTGFVLAGTVWPLMPSTACYDWLYLSALMQFPILASQLLEFDGFTDIEFNPERSLNCQAASAALYVALARRDLLETAMASPAAFLGILKGCKESAQPQGKHCHREGAEQSVVAAVA